MYRRCITTLINRIALIESTAGIGEYFYDGDGKRVKKVVPGGIIYL